MSIYGPIFTRESTSEPVSSDNGETTIFYSGRIATRAIRETIPLINLRVDLPVNSQKGRRINLAFSSTENRHTVRFLRKESRVKIIFIQSRQNATSQSTAYILQYR